MALYDNTLINTSLLSSVFNKLYSAKFVNVVRKKNGLLYAVLGKEETGATPGLESFENLNVTNGNKIEVRTMGKLRTVATVADGSAEVGAATYTYDNNIFGSFVLDYTHFADILPIPESEFVKISGSEAKTASYIDDLFNHVIYSLENTMGNALTAYQATSASTTVWSTGTTSVMTSIFNAVGDGVSTYTSTNVNYFHPTQDIYQSKGYGLIDRSDAANSIYRSATYGGSLEASAGSGQLTLSKIYTLQQRIIANGGMPKVALADALVYGYVQNLTSSAARVDYDDSSMWNAFGGVHLTAFGQKYILEQRLGNVAGSTSHLTSTGALFMLDPTTWKFFKNDRNLTTSGILRDPSRVAAMVLPYGSFTQLVCADPSKNGKMIGITG
jgi:hypothetical protein